MPDVNYLAVALAALSAFILGGLWYSPLLFSKAWVRLNGFNEEELKKNANMGMIFGGAFLCNLICAFVFAMFTRGGIPDIGDGASYGFATGLGIVGFSFGLNYLFERRPLQLWLINAGYFTLQFTIFGVILAAMPQG
ncbi:DUF1761 domain-containing protein [Allosphingosinicella sp.]|uniref:DUF1761 domain-containing protein n=1 Tax=Allosphingosinicella sp. TaxID=2823234 RepID=UPI003783891F